MAIPPLADWMGKLPPEALERSICEVALPCSHNAGARVVKCVPPHTLAEYVGDTVAQLPLMASIALLFASRPAICQSQTISELLESGVRALDLRLGMYEGEIYICHAVVCDLLLDDALRQVADFLATHPDEFVVMLLKSDWNCRHEFDCAEKWQLVQEKLANIFGTMLLEEEQDMKTPLRELRQRGKRGLALLYVRHKEGKDWLASSPGVMARDRNLQTSWRPSTRTVEDMLRVLEEWRDTGVMRPERGKLKFLEVALPVNPCGLAPEALLNFRRFLDRVPLRIGVNLDFPDEATIRAIIAKNWESEAPEGAGD